MGNGTLVDLIHSQDREHSTALFERCSVVYAEFDRLAATLGTNPDQLFESFI